MGQRTGTVGVRVFPVGLCALSLQARDCRGMGRRSVWGVLMFGCMLPGAAARVSLSPKLGVYGDARGGSDLWGICIQAPTMPDTENQAPPRYAPETPLVGLDVAFRAENGFLLQLTVDAALTRLMFCGRCLAGYSFRPGGG